VGRAHPTTAVLAVVAPKVTRALSALAQLVPQLTTAVVVVMVPQLTAVVAVAVKVLEVTTAVVVVAELVPSRGAMAALVLGVVVLVGGVRVRGLLTRGVMRATNCLTSCRMWCRVLGRAESVELLVRRTRGVILVSPTEHDPRPPHVLRSVLRKHKPLPRTHPNRPHPNRLIRGETRRLNQPTACQRRARSEHLGLRPVQP
jgi:hypothetical protein